VIAAIKQRLMALKAQLSASSQVMISLRNFHSSSVSSLESTPTIASPTTTSSVTAPRSATRSRPLEYTSTSTYYPTNYLTPADLFATLSSKSKPGHVLPLGANPELQTLASAVVTTMRKIWSKATWSNRLYLVERLTEFRFRNNLMEDSDLALDWSILLFVQATETIPSSKVTYIKSLAALFRRQGRDLPLCSLLVTALRGESTIPTHQAVPALDHHIDRMLQRAQLDSNPNLELAIFIMYKTASRADEVLRLTKDQFILATPQMIVVEWLSKTKTTRLDPWRTSAWTVIVHPEAPMTRYVEVIKKLEPETPLLDWSTTKFCSWMQSDPATENLSAQSIKRGALTILSHMVLGGQLDISLIPRLAKHKVEFDVFPATTLRYLDDRVTLAKMMRTQEATALLPCLPRARPPLVNPHATLPLPPPLARRPRGRPRMNQEASPDLPPRAATLPPMARPLDTTLNARQEGLTIAERVRQRHLQQQHQH